MEIINLSELRDHRFMEEVIRKLREYEDGFEYCLVEDYEMKDGKYRIENIQVGDVFVTIQESENEVEHVAILFPKPQTVEKIIEWFKKFGISFNESNGMVQKANCIANAVKYKGIPIILVEKGENNISFDLNELDEVTEVYKHFDKIVNTQNARDVEMHRDE